MSKIDLTRFDFRALRFLKSEDVEIMTAEEVGQFVLLMCHAWLGGKDASLPNNPTLLAKYARCERVSDAVMREWNEGPAGRLYNETLSEEWDAAVSRSVHGHARGGCSLEQGKIPYQYLRECTCNARAFPKQCTYRCTTNGQAKPSQSNQAEEEYASCDPER
jgi:uncharacterized protein YdaU (DUF1376 family)